MSGNIASWKKKEGEAVAAGDEMAEIETDKATMAWEAQDEGFIAKILAKEGSKEIAVGDPVAIFVEEEVLPMLCDVVLQGSCCGGPCCHLCGRWGVHLMMECQVFQGMLLWAILLSLSGAQLMLACEVLQSCLQQQVFKGRAHRPVDHWSWISAARARRFNRLCCSDTQHSSRTQALQ